MEKKKTEKAKEGRRKEQRQKSVWNGKGGKVKWNAKLNEIAKLEKCHPLTNKRMSGCRGWLSVWTSQLESKA